MLTPAELEQLPEQLSLDELWFTGIGDDKSYFEIVDRAFRLQNWIKTNCNQTVTITKPPRRFIRIF